jgi:hypothetical protein
MRFQLKTSFTIAFSAKPLICKAHQAPKTVAADKKILPNMTLIF